MTADPRYPDWVADLRCGDVSKRGIQAAAKINDVLIEWGQDTQAGEEVKQSRAAAMEVGGCGGMLAGGAGGGAVLAFWWAVGRKTRCSVHRGIESFQAADNPGLQSAVSPTVCSPSLDTALPHDTFMCDGLQHVIDDLVWLLRHGDCYGQVGTDRHTAVDCSTGSTQQAHRFV